MVYQDEGTANAPWQGKPDELIDLVKIVLGLDVIFSWSQRVARSRSSFEIGSVDELENSCKRDRCSIERNEEYFENLADVDVEDEILLVESYIRNILAFVIRLCPRALMM